MFHLSGESHLPAPLMLVQPSMSIKMNLKDKLVRVETSTIQERVRRSLQNAIMAGQFAPGEILTLRGVADAMGTSVMPVREALSRCLADGAIELLPNRVMRIPLMTPESIEELYEVRITLEGMAAAKAAQRISREEIGTLHKAIEAMQAARERSDSIDFLLANRAFHFGIYRAAQTFHLLPIIETLWLKFGPLLRLPFTVGTHAEKRLMDEQTHHLAAVAALEEHNADMARAALTEDLVSASGWFKAHAHPSVEAVRLERLGRRAPAHEN
jgi:DNA-binding GntR family transcriptional regulator